MYKPMTVLHGKMSPLKSDITGRDPKLLSAPEKASPDIKRTDNTLEKKSVNFNEGCQYFWSVLYLGISNVFCARVCTRMCVSGSWRTCAGFVFLFENSFDVCVLFIYLWREQAFSGS